MPPTRSTRAPSGEKTAPPKPEESTPPAVHAPQPPAASDPVSPPESLGGPPLEGGPVVDTRQDAPANTYRDDQFTVGQLLESSRLILGEPEWLVRAALRQAELGDYVTIDEARQAIDAFRARPVEG